MTMIVDAEAAGDERGIGESVPRKPRTNNGGVGRGSQDGCCDNVGSRARDLLDKVPPCTGKLIIGNLHLFLLCRATLLLSLLRASSVKFPRSSQAASKFQFTVVAVV